MDRGKKIAVGISVAVVLSVAGYCAYKYIYLPYKAKKSAKDTSAGNAGKVVDNASTAKTTTTAPVKTTVTPSASSVEAGVAKAPDAFPLIKGSKGTNVQYLQKALNTLGAGLNVDGNFGEQTYGAVLTKAGTKFYPVDQVSFTAILKMANNKK